MIVLPCIDAFVEHKLADYLTQKENIYTIISENNSKPKIIEQMCVYMYMPVFHLSHFTTGSLHSAKSSRTAFKCLIFFFLHRIGWCVCVLADDKSQTSEKNELNIYHSNGIGMAVDFSRNAYRKRWFNHANYTVIGCCQKQCDFGLEPLSPTAIMKKKSRVFFSLHSLQIVYYYFDRFDYQNS